MVYLCSPLLILASFMFEFRASLCHKSEHKNMRKEGGEETAEGRSESFINNSGLFLYSDYLYK